MSYRKLWIALGLVLVISFAVLGGVGIKVLKSAPPIPSQVVTTEGRVLFDGNAIHDCQGAWQSIGGQVIDGHPTEETSGAVQSALHYFAHAAPKYTAYEEQSLFRRLLQMHDPEIESVF
jgi:nitric oxide reductase large subunit